MPNPRNSKSPPKNNNRYEEKVKYLEKSVDNITNQIYQEINYTNYIRDKANSFITILVLGVGYTHLDKIENIYLKLFYITLLIFLIFFYGWVLFPVNFYDLKYKEWIDDRLYEKKQNLEKLYYNDISFLNSELDKLQKKTNLYSKLYKFYIITLCLTIIITLISQTF
jgi:hypothetical protein